MEKESKQVLGGIAIGKMVQAAIRKYGDGIVAPMLLYTSEQYAKDLHAAGYVSNDTPVKTDAEIGAIILQESGYAFASGPGNLRGTGKLTADPYTYQAAAGQKVAAWKFPSTIVSAILGVAGIAEGEYNYLGNTTRDYKVGATAFGASLLGDGILRGAGIDGTVAAPSGFDATDMSKTPGMQHLDASVVNNMKALSMEIQRLQRENGQLRSANGQLAQAAPHITVTDISQAGSGLPIPDRYIADIKARAGLVGSKPTFAQLQASRAKKSPLQTIGQNTTITGGQ